MLNKKRRDMGLGGLAFVSLAKAREAAQACRALVHEGKDPINERMEAQEEGVKALGLIRTFKQCADDYIKSHQNSWKSAVHRAQWSSTLEMYVHPVIGKKNIALVDTQLVMQILQPIWSTKSETASRTRGRIETILDWATVQKFRSGENPARWKGHLEHLLPAKNKVSKVSHHAALPYEELPSFMATLALQIGISPRGLELLILTATRTSEVLNATWDEISFEHKTWTIPADRMKAAKEHRIPLSEPAMKILQTMQDYKMNQYSSKGGLCVSISMN